MAESDYGSTLTKGGQAIGRCIIIGFPELSSEKINTTNHASNGWSEGIPSGLIQAGDITCMVLLEEGTDITAMIDEMLAKTISEVVLANGVNSFTFDGFYLSVKPEDADAQAPNAVRASVVMTPTGEIEVASVGS